MTEGFRVKKYDQPVKRYVETMDLKDEPELIGRYRDAHRRENFWPEIKAGIKEVGILEMEEYIIGSRVVMVIETSLDFDWDKAMEKLARLPRQQEWEDYVAVFQKCKEGDTSAGKWQLMERMFYLYEDGGEAR